MKTQFSRKGSDQIFQAAVQLRISKPVKAPRYSTIFHMFHQTGTFNDIDTYSATRFVNYNFNSIQSDVDEYRFSMNCPDINDHLNKLIQENTISESFKSVKISFADCFWSNTDYQKCPKGSKCASLEAGIILQDEIKNEQIRDFLNQRYSQLVFCTFTSTGKNIYILVKIWPHMV